MKLSLILVVFASIFSFTNDKTRFLDYNGKKVKTTYEVDQKFIGLYSGSKKGYLQLNSDGTGTYLYDRFGFAQPGCTNTPVAFHWGFILDKENKIVEYQRAYGQSIPIVLQSTTTQQFKGCREAAIVDFLMVKKDNTIGVSSSDDWVKKD